MTTYRVVWEIDIEADTPLEAAKEARRIQLMPDNWATVFDVGISVNGHPPDESEREEIDLDDYEEDAQTQIR